MVNTVFLVHYMKCQTGAAALAAAALAAAPLECKTPPLEGDSLFTPSNMFFRK